jgi:hypothetical protein
MSNPPIQPIIDAAIDYARRGWSVMPIGSKKKPTVRAWKSLQTLRTEPDDVPGWFKRQKGLAGVGIILGEVSGGLFVRDFDDAGAYERWTAAHAEHAQTMPTVKTSRGFHVYGRWKGVRTIPGDDGELRGEGAYVCAPPTLHTSGAIYAWLVPLPAGDVPEVDPMAAGLVPQTSEPACATERTERTETQRDGEDRRHRDTEAVGAAVLAENFDDETLARVEKAIERTLPPKFGKRNRHIFNFARALKAIPTLATTSLQCVARLRPFVAEWHRRALPNIITKDFGTTWGDFVNGWKKAHTPEGEDVLAKALERAEAADPPEWSKDYSPAHRLLAALCRELQRVHGEQPFFLTNALAGELVGVDKGTANRWFHAMLADGALVVVEQPSNGRATRYRYVAPDLHNKD